MHKGNEIANRLVCFSIILILLSSLLHYAASVRRFKQQAFDKGYMVQCVGKMSYYWECEK